MQIGDDSYGISTYAAGGDVSFSIQLYPIGFSIILGKMSEISLLILNTEIALKLGFNDWRW